MTPILIIRFFTLTCSVTLCSTLFCHRTSTQELLDTSFDGVPSFDVASTSPANGPVQGYVGKNYDVTTISISFNKPVDTATLVGSLSIDNGLQVNTVPEYDSKTRTARYSLANNPSLTTSDCTTFFATLSENVKDTKGTPLTKGAYIWTFVPGPCVLSATPTNYSTNLNSISGNTITIKFNETMFAADLNSSVTLKSNPADSSVSIVSRTLAGSTLSIKVSGSPTNTYSNYFLVRKTFANRNGKNLLFDYEYRISGGNYFDNLDGTIYDKTNNITWAKCAVGPVGSESLVFNAATNACDGAAAPFLYFFCTTATDNCNGGVSGKPLQPPPWLGGATSEIYNACQALNTAKFGSRSVWRVPSINEFMTLLRYSTNPAIDTTMFPGANSPYWTASTQVSNPANGWRVNVTSGSSTAGSKSGFNDFVLCALSGK